MHHGRQRELSCEPCHCLVSSLPVGSDSHQPSRARKRVLCLGMGLAEAFAKLVTKRVPVRECPEVKHSWPSLLCGCPPSLSCPPSTRIDEGNPIGHYCNLCVLTLGGGRIFSLLGLTQMLAHCYCRTSHLSTQGHQIRAWS